MAKNEAPTDIAAERRAAVILVAELRNFTRMSEMLEPEAVLQLASQFFTLVEQVAGAHGGNTVGTNNDSIMTAFTGPEPDHAAEQALHAAREIRLEFSVLADTWERDYGLHVSVALGLHLGDTVFGAVGPASAAHYVAFGDTVSIAERLAHRARAGEYILSAPLMRALAACRLDVEPEELPPLELPRRPAIRLYGVLLDTRLDFT